MAVFTKVSGPAFEKFAAEYDLVPPFRLIPVYEGVENTNYRVETRQGTFILTLLEGRSSHICLEIFASLLEHLRNENIPVPRPFRNRTGLASSTLMNKAAILASWLPGRPTTELDGKACRLAGRALAQLHEAGRSFRNAEDNFMGARCWGPYFARFAEDLENRDPATFGIIKEELDFLRTSWPSDLPKGLIHADFFPDNVLFLEGEITGLLDFYYAGEDFLAYDLAIAICAWCGGVSSWPKPPLVGQFVDGYQSVRELEIAEIQALPILLRGACLRFALTRVHDWIAIPKNAMMSLKNPEEYLQKLEAARVWQGIAG